MNDKKDTGFPRSLYTNKGSHKWGRDVYYGYVVVNNEAEYQAALESGYKNDFKDILSGNSIPADEIEEESEGEGEGEGVTIG